MAFFTVAAILGPKAARRSKSRSYSTPNAILGGRGVRHAGRARRSYNKSLTRSSKRITNPYLARRRDTLESRLSRLEAERIRKTPTRLFSPAASLTGGDVLSPRRPPRIRELDRRIERTERELRKVTQLQAHREAKRSGRRDPSLAEVLTHPATLAGIPVVGGVTTAGKLLGRPLIEAGVRAVAQGGAKQAARGITEQAAREAADRAAARALNRGVRSRHGIGLTLRDPRRPELGWRWARMGARGPQRVAPRAAPKAQRPNEAIRRLGLTAEDRAKLGFQFRTGRVVAGKGVKGAAKGSARVATFPIRHPLKTTGRGTQGFLRGQAPLAALAPEVDNPALNVASFPLQTAAAAIERPGKVIPGTVRGIRDALIGIPIGLYEAGAGGYEAVTQGDTSRLDSLWELIKADYEARYGPLSEGDEAEFRRRIAEGYTIQTPEGPIDVPSQGITPMALDVSIAAPPAGRLAGAAARRGVLGPGLRGYATAERPRLRVRAGASLPQDRSRNLFALPFENFMDARRAGATRRRAGQGRRGGVAEAVAREAYLASEAGSPQVVPLRRKKAARKVSAKDKGRALHEMSLLQRAELGRHGTMGEFSKLNRFEKEGIHPSIVLGIKSADQAREQLPKRIEQIRKGRTDDSFKAAKGLDNIRQLEYLIENADKVFTPNLRQFAAAQVARGQRLARLDPDITPETAALREATRQAKLLDVERENLGRVFLDRRRGRGMRNGRDEVRYEHLPEKLYHVTSNLPGVQRAGFLVPETRAGVGLGSMGGGVGRGLPSVSLTPNATSAASIANDMRWVANLAREWRPRLRDGDWGRFKSEADYNQAVRQIKARARQEGFTFDVAAGRGNSLKDLFSAYFQQRLGRTNRSDPWFIRKVDELASIDPDNIGILEVPRSALREDVFTRNVNDTSGPEIRYYADLPVADAQITTRAGRGALVGATGFKSRPGADKRLYDTQKRAQFNTAAEQSMREFGLAPPSAFRAHGVWAGGSEPSHVLSIHSATPEQLDAAISKLGRQYEQDSVIRFIEDEAGTDTAYVFDIGNAKTKDIDALLAKHGFEGGSMTEDGRLLIFTEGDEAKKADAMAADLARHGAGEYDAFGGSFRYITSNEYDQAIQVGQRAAASAVRGRGAQSLGRAGRSGDTPEPAEDFLARTQAKREQAGLAEPGYFRSEIKRANPLHAGYAVGGRRAVQGATRDKLVLHKYGIEDTRVNALVNGFARNIKRAFNWNLVADVLERATLPFSRGADGKGKSVFQHLQDMNRYNIDENSVILWNPGIYRRAAEDIDAADLDVERTGTPEELGAQGMEQVLNEATMTPAEAVVMAQRVQGHSPDSADFMRSRGWYLIDRVEFEEVASGAKDSLVGRVLGLATQKQSRILLGTLNIPWLQFQIMSNGFLTGLAGTGPFDLVKAQLWWRKLSKAEKRAIAPYIGEGAFTADRVHQKLGAAANNSVVNAWRGFKEAAAGKHIWKTGAQVRDLNPLDLMFRMDNAQNNFFRRGVFYSALKRDAYRRMGEATSDLGQLQNRISNMLTLGPEDLMRQMAREVPTLERHGQRVADILGDYLTFTSAERRFLKRNVIFYGFLRFSLRLAFYTMPVKHPVMSGILGTLSRLEVAEVRDLLGGEELPYALGRIYSDNGNVVFDLSRANPVLNALTQAGASAASTDKLFGFTGLLPPLYGTALTMIFQREAFTGKPLRVLGENQPRENLGIPWPERLRAALAQGLRMFYPYRVAEDLTFRTEPQGADSLVWSPRPTQYKDEEIQREIAKTVAEYGSRGTESLILEQLFPYLPRPSRDVEIAKRIRQSRALEERTLDPTPRAPSDPLDAIRQEMGFSGSGNPALDRIRKQMGF